MVIPGSHLWTEPLPRTPGEIPDGAIEVLAKAGDVTLFERRIWHGRSTNLSDRTRMVVFYGYSPRWIVQREFPSAEQLDGGRRRPAAPPADRRARLGLLPRRARGAAADAVPRRRLTASSLSQSSLPSDARGRSVPQTLGRELRALRERLELRPGDLRVHAPAQPAVGRRDDVLAADDLRVAGDAVGDELGVLDHVRGVADDAGHQHLALGQLDVLPQPPLVLVAGVRGLERVRPGVDREHHVDEVRHRQVGEVRSVPAAPAEVEADALRAAARGSRG